MGRRRDLLDSLYRDTVIVHLDDGTSIRGILEDVASDCVVLIHSSALGETPVPIDGEAILPRTRIAWIQRLLAEAQ